MTSTGWWPRLISAPQVAGVMLGHLGLTLLSVEAVHRFPNELVASGLTTNILEALPKSAHRSAGRSRATGAGRHWSLPGAVDYGLRAMTA